MEAINFACDQKIDVVLVDTAGRMQDNEPLMRALAKVKCSCKHRVESVWVIYNCFNRGTNTIKWNTLLMKTPLQNEEQV
jgi:signal recognition particle GTPase